MNQEKVVYLSDKLRFVYYPKADTLIVRRKGSAIPIAQTTLAGFIELAEEFRMTVEEWNKNQWR